MNIPKPTEAMVQDYWKKRGLTNQDPTITKHIQKQIFGGAPTTIRHRTLLKVAVKSFLEKLKKES